MRLAAVVLLALLATGFAVMAVVFAVLEWQVIFASATAAALGTVLVLALLVAAVAYGLSASWVAKQVRGGHLAAIGVTLVGSLLSLTAAMDFWHWLALLGNLLALGCLSASIPRRR